MDFDRTWTMFAADAEVDHFGTKRLVDAHNTKVAALEAKLEEPAHCNSGHETLPLKLWTCPTCHEELEAKLEAMKQALVEISEQEDELCSYCTGSGGRYADGGAHYPSENAPVVPCGQCGGSGKMPPPDARDLAASAIAAPDVEVPF